MRTDVETTPATSFVEKWCAHVREAKAKWKDDYDRMRQGMEFAAGFQWDEQAKMSDDRYTNNITLRAINLKVSNLYARNPKAVAERRPRLDFQIWDGSQEALMGALVEAQQSGMMGMPAPVERALVLAGLRRNSAGGFGGAVPEPSQSSGFG